MLSDFETLLLRYLKDIAAILAHLVAIDQKRLHLEFNDNPMVTSAELKAFFDIVTQLIKAKSDDDATIASLQQQVNTQASQLADISDPALEQSLNTLSDTAKQATVNPNAPATTPPDQTQTPPDQTPQVQPTSVQTGANVTARPS